MTRSLSLLFTLALAVMGISAEAQEVFLQSDWLNAIPGPPPGASSVAIWSGGNESVVDPGTALDAPRDNNGIHLISSAIGQMTSQILGSPQAFSTLEAVINQAVINGESYRFTAGPLGSLVTNPAVAWAIVFPGGFDTTNGTVFPAGTSANFDTNQLNVIDAALRARLAINPLDAAAAQQLVLLQEDRMLPLEWSGIEALAYADKARLLGLPGPGGTNEETYCIELARGYFQHACNLFSQFLANPPDAALAEGQNPFVSAAVSNQVAQVLDDYLRDLSEYAQASLSDFQIRSLAAFYDPSQQPQQTTNFPAATQALLADIDAAHAEIHMRLLQASPFKSLPAYTISAASQVRGLARQIGRMHHSVVNGQITFVAGASGDASTNSSLYYNSFSTSFVPLFSSQLTQGGAMSSFSLALGFATNFLQYAAEQETAASNAIMEVTQLAYDYTSNQTQLASQYSTQLANLCGYATFDKNGDPNPDIFFAGLPPGERESVASQFVTNGTYQLTEEGSIYQEWKALEAAEENLVLANLNLSNTFATMLEKQMVADAIYSNQVRLASTILSNGQQIAAIDVQEGQVQAQADLEFAQIQSSAAQSQSGSSSFLSEAGSVIETVGPIIADIFARRKPGAGLSGPHKDGGPDIGSILDVFSGDDNSEDDGADDDQGDYSDGGDVGSQMNDAYENEAAALQTAQVQANTATQLAQLNAQIAQIQALDQAQTEYVDADTTMLDLSADLSALQMKAQSQAVQIQVAALNVDQEKSKLSTMLSQVAYLLQQYVRAATLAASSPQFSTNLLTARNTTMQQANDAFVLAQQWAFLAAQLFNYEDNCAADVSQKNYLPGVLAARNTSVLAPILENMASSKALLAASCQGAVSSSYVTLSLRNQVFQQNSVQTIGTNSVTIYEPILQDGVAMTNGAASLTAWTSLLQQHLTMTTTNGISRRTLLLDVRISIDPETVNEVPYNPFWSCQDFGGTIAGYTNAGVQCQGVQVNISTGGLSLPNNTVFTVQLAQNGASTIRNLGYANPASFLRYFNFGYYAVDQVGASWNNLAGSFGTSSFQDRSPANDDWQLAISDDFPGGPNTTLLNNLNTITDIQLAFGIQSYTDPVAAFNCTH